MSSETVDQSAQVLSEVVPGRGILVVVSSPSGGGKGTLIRLALKSVPNLGYSVSFTTRPPREGEVNGREYFFVSRDEFERMVEARAFLEWAHVHENLYGTSQRQVEHELLAGHDIVLEVDVQGAATIRGLGVDALSVFILPPSFEVLKARLEARGSEDNETLALRLSNAQSEVRHYAEFKYVIINDDAERAAELLASIIYAERARRERQEDAARKVISSFDKSSIS